MLLHLLQSPLKFSWFTFNKKKKERLLTKFICLNCFITNCINLTMSPGSFMVGHQLHCILLSANISQPWYDDLWASMPWKLLLIYFLVLTATLQPWSWVSHFNFYHWNYICLYYGPCTSTYGWSYEDII